jgi:hypothetical protein
MRSRPLMTLRLSTAPTQNIGPGPRGTRLAFPITGGSFEGDRLRGKVLPGGGDWVVNTNTIRFRRETTGGVGVLSHEMKEFPSDAAKLHDYEAFITIVDTGNLTRAAVAFAGRCNRSAGRSRGSKLSSASSSSAAPPARRSQPKRASPFIGA